MASTIDQVLRTHPQIWRGSRGISQIPTWSTGHAPLDAVLPGGGWPTQGLIELWPQAQGVGEISLLLPLIARLSQAGRPVVWIAPPYLPYAPALASAGVNLQALSWVNAETSRDALWCLDSALRSKACALALAWPGALRAETVRRLQVAAQEGATLAVLFRHAGQPAPQVSVRLSVAASGDVRSVKLLKARGTHLQTSLSLSR